jgi:hypothetical protein
MKIFYPSINCNPDQYLFGFLHKWRMEVNAAIHGYKPQLVIQKTCWGPLISRMERIKGQKLMN